MVPLHVSLLFPFNFALRKGDFRDALYHCHDWQPCLLPSSCVCGQSLTVEHAMHCPVVDFTQLIVWYHCITTHWGMPCSGNRTLPTTSIRRAAKVQNSQWCRWSSFRCGGRKFWSKNRQMAFFYVKVFNPFSKSYVNTPLAQCHRRLEQDKWRSY